jgi:hypothetical protein
MLKGVETKTCSICKEAKEAPSFGVKGLWCKECKSLNDKKYYQANKDKIKAQTSAYYNENREQITAKWRTDEHKQKLQERRHASGVLEQGTPEFKEMIKARPQNNMTGEKNPRWAGDDYKGRRNSLYRKLVGKVLGRDLEASEDVHHKDGDFTNNNIDNLEVMSRAEHMRIHAIEHVKQAVRDEKGRFVSFNQLQYGA